MRRITKEEYAALPIVNWVRQCPGNTDYSLVNEFGDYATFGHDTTFGHDSTFGNYVTFGTCATFGDYAKFGNGATFGDYAKFDHHATFLPCAKFGDYAKFGDHATFGGYATFRPCAKFGDYAKFGDHATFGGYASFGEGATFEGINSKAKPGNPLLQFDRVGSRVGCTQFFNLECGIFVRCGCKKLPIDEFRKAVLDTYGDTGHGMIYLGLCTVAEEYFRQEDDRNAKN